MSSAVSSSVHSRQVWAAALLLAGATLLVYARTFSAPFAFDDFDSIVNNSSLRHGWDLGAWFNPPHELGQTVGGRPVLNASLGLNYQLGGLSVAGYHWTNLLIHLGAGLALFGLVRQLASRPGVLSEQFALRAAWLLSLIWLVHPLQTESVTYVVQRAESLMGLFYFLTLYAGVRSAGSKGRGRLIWSALAFFACLAGMGTKEVMVSAPMVALLLDRALLSGSFRNALRLRGWLYLALAATWIWVIVLVSGSGARGGTVGMGVGVSWGSYLLTQGPAIARYLRLAIFPTGQIFDYGAEWVSFREAWVGCALVVVLGIAAVWGLWKNTVWGVLLTWMLLILAPTSLLPGIRQIVAEHRFYVALAPFLALLFLAAWSVGRGSKAGRWVIFGTGLAGALALGITASARNFVYASPVALWSDTVAKRPNNAYAHNDLGDALRTAGRNDEAIREFDRALALKPNLPEAENNLGNILLSAGRPDAAVPHLERAIALRPGFAEANSDLGAALLALGQTDQAIGRLREALAIRPAYADASFNLGVAYDAKGDRASAMENYRRALELNPALTGARLDLANDLARGGAFPEAESLYQEVLVANPGLAMAHFNHANALAMAGRLRESEAEYQRTIQLDPTNAQAKLFLQKLQAYEAKAGRAP